MHIQFERTHNAEYIYQCLTDTKVWRMSCDDNTPSPELFFIPLQDEYIWVKAGGYGLFFLYRKSADTYEVHLALNRGAIGVSEEISHKALHWGFENIKDCRTMIANIPAFNHLAQGLAKRAGFKFHGINQGLFVKEGKQHDIHVFILSKEEICHLPQAQQQQ